jgi:hypothetical protein
MSKKRLLIAALVIPICLIPMVVVAEKASVVRRSSVIDPSCSSSNPCIEYDNNGTGPGLRGHSLSGNGIGGATFFNSTTPSNGHAGVFGNDDSSSGTFDSGVSGSSVRGNGVSGNSSSGFGILATSSGWAGEQIVGGYSNGAADEFIPALSIIGSTAGDFTFGTDLIDACQVGVPSTVCYNNDASFRVDYFGDVIAPKGTLEAENGQFSEALSVGTFTRPASGDINVTGEYLKAGSCVAGCPAATARSSGRAVGSYASLGTVPTIEDYGEAQLANGQAYVTLEREFANVIDQQRSYLVFLTPEGDNRGLYVTQKTVRGFVVRESQGGHSSIAFSYRIIAKPYGNDRPRLPVVTLSARSTLVNRQSLKGIQL